LHWYRGLDAYFFSRQNVDPRTADPAKAIAAFAYTIQPRHSLGGYRYGFYEPEPVGARRPGVWVYHDRMRLNRKVIVGHWQQEHVVEGLGQWMRVAAGRHDLKGAKFVRFGDNMRQVAVTDGDKVAAEMTFGFSVNTYAVGDLVAVINQVSDEEVSTLTDEYESLYQVGSRSWKGRRAYNALRDAARIELGMKYFLQDGNFKGYTNTFEDLHGMKQLPGIGSQRMMAAGYGYAGEGDWKTSAMVRALKVMASGLDGGNSFMEDYTYHFNPSNNLVLGSHMLEICPSIATGQPSCEIHPLGIGGKEDPVRLVFNAPAGPAIECFAGGYGQPFQNTGE
jgi:L-arabinose isomerase